MTSVGLVGTSVGLLGALSRHYRDTSTGIDIKPTHNEKKPRGHTNVNTCMLSWACIHLLAGPLASRGHSYSARYFVAMTEPQN